MVRNNYHALTYVIEHLNEPITEELIITIAEIVTKSASETEVTGYRSAPVYINDPNGVVYTPPDAKAVPEMMKQLFSFIQSSDLHPVLKTCIAHFYFVYVHPFNDGNGRTARTLSCMMLLQSGYDFFRFTSISDLVAQQGLSHIFYVQQSFSEISSKAYAPQWRAVPAGELPATY